MTNGYVPPEAPPAPQYPWQQGWQMPEWMPEFGWPWQQWYPQVQDFATEREPYMPLPWYRQIPLWGAQAGLGMMNRINPYFDPWRERFPPYPWW